MNAIQITHIIQITLLTIVILLIAMRAVHELRKNRCKKCGSFNTWPHEEVQDVKDLPKCDVVVHGIRCRKCGHFERGSVTSYRSKETGGDAVTRH